MEQKASNTVVACPSCTDEFDTVQGMKIHHAQAHNRSLTHDFRAEMHLFAREYAGENVLLTAFDDDTAASHTLYGTLTGGDGRITLDTDKETWDVLWLGGAEPAGYYVHPPESIDDEANGITERVRVVRLQIVGEVRVTAGDAGLEMEFDNLTDISTQVNSG